MNVGQKVKYTGNIPAVKDRKGEVRSQPDSKGDLLVFFQVIHNEIQVNVNDLSPI